MRSRTRLLVGIMAVVTVMGIIASTGVVSAQSAAGSFNPQTQFQVGSKLIIGSVYGVASPRPQGGYGESHSWNQSQQNLPTYTASVTINLQVTGQDSDGGIQFIVQGGVMVIDGSTIAITGGSGQMSSMDRIFIQGAATSIQSQSINWRINGLAAILNGELICELNGNAPVVINGAPTNLILTYIATIS